MRELTTQIEFDGTPDEVWEVLQDLTAHAEWNPFITKIDGELRPGAKLNVRLCPLQALNEKTTSTKLKRIFTREFAPLKRPILISSLFLESQFS